MLCNVCRCWGKRINDMHRSELSRKVCGWLVRGGSAELLWQFTVAIKSDPVVSEVVNTLQ